MPIDLNINLPGVAYGIERRAPTMPVGTVISGPNPDGTVEIYLAHDGRGIPGVITGNELRVYREAIRERVERELLTRSREGFLDTAYGSSLTALASSAYSTDRLYGETDEWQVYGREPMSIPPWSCFQVQGDDPPKEGRTRYQAILEDDVFEGVVW